MSGSSRSRRLTTMTPRIGTHTSHARSVAFSPDGKQVVSGEPDHSVRLYTRTRVMGLALGSLNGRDPW